MADTIVIEVARYSPETDAEPHFQKYEVPLRGDWMVLDALNYINCITCMLCYSAGPVYGIDPHFTGPAALALAERYNLDSRDQGVDERLDILSQHDGIWDCTVIGECSEVCPKEVDPSLAIQEYKIDATKDWFKTWLM